MSLCRAHLRHAVQDTVYDITNNVFIRYFEGEMLYTAPLIKLLSIVSTNFCGSVRCRFMKSIQSINL